MPEKPVPGVTDEAGPAAYPEAKNGSRGKKAGINIAQSRQIGQDSPLEGSRQGRERDKADPGGVEKP